MQCRFLSRPRSQYVLAFSARSYSQSASDGKPISLTQGPLASVVKPYIDRHELAGAVILAADRDRVIDRRGHRLRGHRQPQSS
jgi:hypothetical protein